MGQENNPNLLKILAFQDAVNSLYDLQRYTGDGRISSLIKELINFSREYLYPPYQDSNGDMMPQADYYSNKIAKIK